MKKIMIQIFSGGYLEDKVQYSEIEQKALPLLQSGCVHGVLIGWSVKAEVYKKVIQLAHAYNAVCYLWLPVFSEIGWIEGSSLLVDDQENKVQSYELKEGEKFEFYCPNQKSNRENVIRIYEKYFMDLPFDGVFLDKIRYSSFANGISGDFNCFCEACQQSYKKNGIDYVELKEEMAKVKNQHENYGRTPMGIKSYHNGRYKFTNPLWEQFFTWKKARVTEALREIIGYFRSQGKKVGVDTLSPFMAEFVGQDYEELRTLVDFFKPMMYAVTNAPAGLPFEYEHMLIETMPKSGEKVRNQMNNLLGIEKDGVTRIDHNFIKKELETVCQYQVPVMCGIEVNSILGIANVTPEYIRETMEELSKTDIQGFVLSWDLLSAPEENIQAVQNVLRKEGWNG